MKTILDIKNLTVNVGQDKILNNVSLSIPSGKIIGIVGGSGSGKTTLGLSVLNLLPTAMRVAAGSIIFEGKDLLALPSPALRCIRGFKIGMIFQEPLSAFDPLFTIGAQLDETLAAHTTLHVNQRHEKISAVLKSVEIEDPDRIADSYPHELSGGLRQRAMIAQAIIGGPRLIIADEATSSLDVTIQAKIIRLLQRLNQEQGISILFIAHDLGLVSFLAHEVAVMTQGNIVEYGQAQEILNDPKHDYTKALLKAY